MTQLRFLLNDREVALSEVAPSDMLLDHIRLGQLLTGTKEGCAEGDCGACTVLSGRLTPSGLVYAPINACIRPLAACHGTHVVTVEHLRGAQGGLHPVQAAMVAHHASQCGFCTPGIVMALYALWMEDPDPSEARIETALQGNICRCTGYRPIIDAARAAARAGGQAMDALAQERADVAARLGAMTGRVDVARDGARAIVPADLDDLARTHAAHPEATLIAGATDVGLWVTKFLRPLPMAIFAGHLMKDVALRDGALHVGAGVTYSELLPVLEDHLPQLRDYWLRIAGWQVRNLGTVGANIANGSPIGDTPPVLIALGARIVLRHGDSRREMPLESFFIDYGKQDRRPGEFLEEVIVPLPDPDARIAAFKVSKRRDSDISAVAMGLMVTVKGGVIADARIACGGMAATPRRAAGAEDALRGRAFDADAFAAAALAIDGDFDPIGDMRASAGYRAAVARNLIRRFWLQQSDPGLPTTLRDAEEAA